MNKKKMKRFMKLVFVFVFMMTLSVVVPSENAYADTKSETKTEETSDMSAVTAPFETLTSLVSTIVSAIGVVVALWGVSEFGMAMQGNNGGMESQGLKRVGGALIMVMAPQILTILT